LVTNIQQCAHSLILGKMFYQCSMARQKSQRISSFLTEEVLRYQNLETNP